MPPLAISARSGRTAPPRPTATGLQGEYVPSKGLKTSGRKHHIYDTKTRMYLVIELYVAHYVMYMFRTVKKKVTQVTPKRVHLFKHSRME